MVSVISRAIRPVNVARMVLGALLAAIILTPGVAMAAPSTTGLYHRHVCGPASVGFARCHAIVRTYRSGAPAVTTTPSGYGPAALQSAYALPSATNGAGQVFAIVDAYDDPNAASDLSNYRATFGLGPCLSSGSSPCFRKVNQAGGTRMPHANGGWAQETSLDLDMASAICPNCRVLLVEASSASFADLGTAVDTAVSLGATVVSNSYGGSEFASEVTSESHYHHPGVAITVSSGDSGYGASFPAASQYVTAVGGTSLKADSSTRGWSETAWSGAGSGCSAFEPKPSWQADQDCARRTIADVSAVADPNTGVAVYDSYAFQGYKGWMVFGGTSVSAPVIAGVYALAGTANVLQFSSLPYATTSALFDVTSGSNGSCSSSYLCTAAFGYDGPTGLGTPNTAAAF